MKKNKQQYFCYPLVSLVKASCFFAMMMVVTLGSAVTEISALTVESFTVTTYSNILGYRALNADTDPDASYNINDSQTVISTANLESIFVASSTGNGSILFLGAKWGWLDIENVPVNSVLNVSDAGYSASSKIDGLPLFYPNPFRQSDGAELGYRLTSSMDVELLIYDIRANKVFQEFFPAGTMGGLQGYNKLTLNLASFLGRRLSASVYFFILINEGEVIGKGKFAVYP